MTVKEALFLSFIAGCVAGFVSTNGAIAIGVMILLFCLYAAISAIIRRTG